MKRMILGLSVFAILVSAPARTLAGQNLYVLNQGDRNVTIVETWSGRVLGTFRTASKVRDLDAGHHGDFVVVAADDEIGWLTSANGFRQIDLLFDPIDAGEDSWAVGVSPDDVYVYLAQATPSRLYRVDLEDSSIRTCPDGEANDEGVIVCGIPDRGFEWWWSDVESPRHMAVCDDGAVYVVGLEGDLERYVPNTPGPVLVVGSSALLADPRGIACTPENGVVIVNGDRTLTEVSPGASPSLTVYRNVPVQDPGRIDVDPRRFGANYQVLLTDRTSDEIVRLQNGVEIERIPMRALPGAGQPTPWAVTAAASGMLGTANQGLDSATVLYAPFAQLVRPAGQRPIDADFGPVQGAAVEADPYRLEFVYGAGGSSNAPTREMRLRSTGTSDLEISSLQIVQPGSDFSIVAESCTNRRLAPRDSCGVTIGFNPGTQGPPTYAHSNGDLRVLHNGDPTPVSDFPLTAIHFKEYLTKQLAPPTYVEP